MKSRGSSHEEERTLSGGAGGNIASRILPGCEIVEVNHRNLEISTYSSPRIYSSICPNFPRHQHQNGDTNSPKRFSSRDMSELGESFSTDFLSNQKIWRRFPECLDVMYFSSVNYMIAAYGGYSASATGGNAFARDSLAGIAALYATPMYEILATSIRLSTEVRFWLVCLAWWCFPCMCFTGKGILTGRRANLLRLWLRIGRRMEVGGSPRREIFPCERIRNCDRSYYILWPAIGN